MAPLTSIAAVVAEEKEQNTLRVLLMSNVRPWEYLLGCGSYIWLACMLGSLVICAAGSYTPRERAAFMLIMAAGITASLLIGLAIGAWSRTQIMATSLSIPIMMIFSFLPMLSMFHTGIAKIAKYTYSQQISLLLNQVGFLQLHADNVIILAVNMCLFIALFFLAYKKCGLD
ncbi:MAG: ABC transporter permease [Butyrivibrio sp.]|nr:ABC transporter permease [Butyrivibrio sp.]